MEHALLAIIYRVEQAIAVLPAKDDKQDHSGARCLLLLLGGGSGWPTAASDVGDAIGCTLYRAIFLGHGATAFFLLGHVATTFLPPRAWGHQWQRWC